MIYKIVTADIDNAGNVTLGKRTQTITWPHELRIGGLYFLRKHKLYKVIGEEKPLYEQVWGTVNHE